MAKLPHDLDTETGRHRRWLKLYCNVWSPIQELRNADECEQKIDLFKIRAGPLQEMIPGDHFSKLSVTVFGTLSVALVSILAQG